MTNCHILKILIMLFVNYISKSISLIFAIKQFLGNKYSINVKYVGIKLSSMPITRQVSSYLNNNCKKETYVSNSNKYQYCKCCIVVNCGFINIQGYKLSVKGINNKVKIIVSRIQKFVANDHLIQIISRNQLAFNFMDKLHEIHENQHSTNIE